MSSISRPIRLTLVCVATMCLLQHSVASLAAPEQQSQAYWRAQIQEAIDSDVKHDTGRAEALYRALLKKEMPLYDLMEVEARFAIILLYQNRIAEADKYIDAIIKQSAKLTDKNSAANGVLAICMLDLAATLNYSIKTREDAIANLTRAIAVRRVFCSANSGIIGDYQRLANCQCAVGDFRGADATLTLQLKAMKEIGEKSKNWVDSPLEMRLIQAILQDKIAHDKHNQKEIDGITAEMSKHASKACVYENLGMAHTFVFNAAEANHFYQLAQKSIDVHTREGKDDEQRLLSYQAAIAVDRLDWNDALDKTKKRLALLKELHTEPIEYERIYRILVTCYQKLHRPADEKAALHERDLAIAAIKKQNDWMVEDERSVELEEAKRESQRSEHR